MTRILLPNLRRKLITLQRAQRQRLLFVLLKYFVFDLSSITCDIYKYIKLTFSSDKPYKA